ncbi:TPA: hypothetical protein DIC20_02800 [Candidatus Dependentiae bacterium]|nr:MAG: hypothetical protein US03_C0009G0021 [candidate division TM6 bacterium GW2011_GWF2_36_131]KKQ02859.1 MAG: hypothetical protein US13_C0009G0051 [candidate division TM6 bacterium GW2011_GWE2_36_25]KKQ19512.1 MAG: hypothetical protein US32_C0008G0013 [candidate division TM6 bacterium GW2011_GWA2_36_9]HBR70225.1 hypothetical protein [Candidatus Dependentiae bacterium]HCU00609.1 hypothetical protein [Candidatus Dependentiae bacterium]
MIKKVKRTILEQLQSLFLNGLFMLLPVTITFYLFKFAFRIIQSWIEPLRSIEPEYLRAIPYLEFALALSLILLLGLISRNFIFKQLMHYAEKVILKIPLIRPVYNGSKQIVHAFTHNDKTSFQQVIFIEFPRKGVYSLGFLTSELKPEFAPHNGDDIYYNVFIPTTPNPTTGYYIIAKKDDFKLANLTRQEAMSLIISGGIIQPERPFEEA